MDNDYELIYMAQENEELEEEVYKKYKNLIYKKILKYCNSGNIDDYLNEAKLALHKSIENYQDKVPYICYLNMHLNSAIINFRLKEQNRETKEKNKIDALENIYNQDIKNEENKKYNPETIFFEELKYNILKNKIIDKLTYEEELVFTLKEQNYKAKEIAEITDNNLKKIYNIINRIRIKVSNIMSNENNY